jgi:hypothetical protein
VLQLLPQAVPAAAPPALHPFDAVIIMLKIDQLRLQIGVVQNKMRSRYSRGIVPISRSAKGCESGTKGTVLISVTSKNPEFEGGGSGGLCRVRSARL